MTAGSAYQMIILAVAWLGGQVSGLLFPGAAGEAPARPPVAGRHSSTARVMAGGRPLGTRPRLPLAGTVPMWVQARPVRVPGCPWDCLAAGTWDELYDAGDTCSWPALAG